MKKTLMLFLLLLALPIVSAFEWDRYGHDERGSFIQGIGNTIVSDNFTVNTGSLNYSYSYAPIISDWNNDGLNELVTINQENEIRIYQQSGSNLVLQDVYLNENITPSGQYIFSNFINSSEEQELILVVSTTVATKELWALNWNGSDFFINFKVQLGTEDSNGLNCINIDTDGNIECVYYGSNGNLYAYDETNNFNTSPIYVSGDTDTDCTDLSIPEFYDFDQDGDQDIFMNYGCVNVAQLENDGTGTYTLDYDHSSSCTDCGLTGFALADLDGGALELVMLNSIYWTHTSNPSPLDSVITVRNTFSGLLACSDTMSCSVKNSEPYLTALRTSYIDGQDSNSDYNGDTYNDIYVLAVYPNNNCNMTMFIYDIGCNGGEIFSFEIVEQEPNTGKKYPILTQSSATGTSKITYDFPKGIWGNLDSDDNYEIMFMGGVYDVNNGQIQRGIANESGYTHDITSHYLIGNIVNNGFNEIITQNKNYLPTIKSYTFGFTNTKPTITELSFDTGNPVCIGETVTYSLSYDDDDNFQTSRVKYDCFGNSTFLTTTFKASPIEFKCTYEQQTNLITTAILQDSAMNISDHSINISHAVTITNAENCNEAGENGGTEIGSETGIAGGVDDWAGTIPNWLNSWGFKSAASKIFFGIVIIFAILYVLNGEYKSAFVSVIGAVLGVVALSYLGIFPIWLVFLLFLFATLIVFLAIFKFSGSGAGD